MKPSRLLYVLGFVLSQSAVAGACPDAARPAVPQVAFGPEQKPEALIAEAIRGNQTFGA